MINNNYLESIQKQFLYYKTIGEKAIDQLEPEQLFISVNEDTNSIAMIIQHLSGNMLSRFTDFLTTDGEKPWRNRESEFENDITTKAQLMELWEKGWACMFDAINPLTEADLEKEIFIRNQGHTIIEAINRQLAHYPYHIGQIVFIGKTSRTVKEVASSLPLFVTPIT